MRLLPVFLLAFFASLRLASAEPVGVIVAPAELETQAARAARQHGLAWPVEPIDADQAYNDAPLNLLNISYVEADFPSCLEQEAKELDTVYLMERRLLRQARKAATTRAACAFGLGDLSLAEKIVAPLLVQAISVADLPVQTSPEFQEWFEKRRRAVISEPRIKVRFVTGERAVALHLDGRSVKCRKRCEVEIYQGVHIYWSEGPGYRSSAVSAEILAIDEIEPQEISLKLEPISAAGVRDQLRFIWQTAQPADLARWAAKGFDRDRVLLVHYRGKKVGALLYSGERGTVLGWAQASGEDAASVAVQTLLQGRDESGTPTPLLRRPLFWVAVGGTAAVLGGAALYFFTRPEEQHRIEVFP
jgi:hypothetical protein